jgi:hypothetical protein
MWPQRDDFVPMGTMRFYSDDFFPTPLYCANGCVQMTGDSHYFSEEEDDTTQAPYPRVDQCRPTLSNAYQSSYAEDDNFPHIER